MSNNSMPDVRLRSSDDAADPTITAFIPALVYVDPKTVVVAEQPRSADRAADTADLARSVSAVGFSLSVITVFRNSDGDWQLISGERRLRFALEAGLARIPAFDLTLLPEERRHLAQGLENEVRLPLTPFERARWVADRKVVADILALSCALSSSPPPLESTRGGREAQLATLKVAAEDKGLPLRPPNLAAWSQVEQELDLDERSRKRLVKLAGLDGDVAAILEPLALPQDTLLELADWETDTRLLAAEAVATPGEAPTKRAVAVASAVAAQLTEQAAAMRGRQRGRPPRLRDVDDGQHLISYAGEIVLSQPTLAAAVDETYQTIRAYLGSKYKGRHLKDEDGDAAGEDAGQLGDEAAAIDGTISPAQAGPQWDDGDDEDGDDDEDAGVSPAAPQRRGSDDAARDDGDDLTAVAAVQKENTQAVRDIELRVERAYAELEAVAALVAAAPEATRRRVEARLAALGLLLDKLAQACWLVS